MQYNLNRWYDPVIGQWMSEDPIGFAAGDANVRRYVGNSPLDKVDPSGLVESELTFGRKDENSKRIVRDPHNQPVVTDDGAVYYLWLGSRRSWSVDGGKFTEYALFDNRKRINFYNANGVIIAREWLQIFDVVPLHGHEVVDEHSGDGIQFAIRMVEERTNDKVCKVVKTQTKSLITTLTVKYNEDGKTREYGFNERLETNVKRDNMYYKYYVLEWRDMRREGYVPGWLAEAFHGGVNPDARNLRGGRAITSLVINSEYVLDVNAKTATFKLSASSTNFDTSTLKANISVNVE